MKLSIVTTLYQSAPYLIEFYERITAAAKKLVDQHYEIILVNDGSPDHSLDLAISLFEQDSHVTIIDLSRNFGHHKAMMTGLSQAQGERVFLIDSDLEESPEYLFDFTQQMEHELSDVVFGVQEKRRGGLFERVSGWMYYRIFRFLTGVAQPDNICTVRLMSRRYVKALLLHQEREINIGALWCITGFKQSQRVIQKHHSSPTTYSFSRKLSHVVNAITSFSGLPLVFACYIGFFVSMGSFLYIIYLIFRYAFIASMPSGYTSIIASIWLMGGLIIFFIGILGVYLSKIFSEVKQRPYTIVRHIYRKTS